MPETPVQAGQPVRPSRKRRRWLITMLVIATGFLLVLWSRLGSVDPRLVGYWIMPDGTPCVLDSDGGAYAGADLAKDPNIRRTQRWWVQADRIYWQFRHDAGPLGENGFETLKELLARATYLSLYTRTPSSKLPFWLMNQFSSDEIVSVDEDTLVLKYTGVLRRARH
jgi:hypothetical protein